MQCRHDHLAHQLRARGKHQQQLGLGGQPVLRRIEHDAAYSLAQRCATGLARLHQSNASLLDASTQTGEQGAFPGTFAAFDADEFPLGVTHRQCFRW